MVDVLLAAQSSSLGSFLISGFLSSVSIGSCFGSTASGSSFTVRGLVSSFYLDKTTVYPNLKKLKYPLYQVDKTDGKHASQNKKIKLHTSVFRFICFELLSSSCFITGLVSVLLVSGKTCFEASSATEAGVETLLSILAAAWDSLKGNKWKA